MLGLYSAPPAGKEAAALGAGHGALAGQVEIKYVQEGFSGITGILKRINPQGEWEIYHFFNKEPHALQASGRLSPKNLDAIAEVLNKNPLASLPEVMGKDFKVNRRLITVRYGDAQATLRLRAGQKARDALKNPGVEEGVRTFVTIVETIENALEQPSPSP